MRSGSTRTPDFSHGCGLLHAVVDIKVSSAEGARHGAMLRQGFEAVHHRHTRLTRTQAHKALLGEIVELLVRSFWCKGKIQDRGFQKTTNGAGLYEDAPPRSVRFMDQAGLQAPTKKKAADEKKKMERVKTPWFFEVCTPTPRYACGADGATVLPKWRIAGQPVHVIYSTNSHPHFTHLPATCCFLVSLCVFSIVFFVVCWSLGCTLLCSEV